MYYIAKGINEITGNPFWLFDRSEIVEDYLSAYNLRNSYKAKVEILDIEMF